MQPLAYLAVRSLLSWFQFLERHQSAFIFHSLLLLATGALHCWAVVYALFISIHTRAMRVQGYHEGYQSHLPWWVSWTETIASASMCVWWGAGFGTAVIRIFIMDEDARGLPCDRRDIFAANPYLYIFKSKALQNGITIAQALSCVGLFAAIFLLCFALGMMKGTITICEFCLCIAGAVFAAPHVILSIRRFASALVDGKKSEDSRDFGDVDLYWAEAAAQEASLLGPQLTVMLSLADLPAKARAWQNAVHILATLAYAVSVTMCGRSPPKATGTSLPPQLEELVACNLVNVLTAVAVVACFPYLNSWRVWVLAGILAICFAAIYYKDFRNIVIEFVEPVFVMRSDSDKAFLDPQRELARKACWLLVSLSCIAGLWEICLNKTS